MDRLDDPRLVRFVDAARRFRAVIDDLDLKQRALLRALFSPLADLYAAGVGLEEVELEDAQSPALSELDPAWEELPPHVDMDRLRDRIGKDTIYWFMFDPTTATSEEEPVAGHLGNDLLDAYRDVIPGLRGWELDPQKYGASALSEWRNLFCGSWGNRVLSALTVINNIECQEGWGGSGRRIDRMLKKDGFVEGAGPP